VIKAKKYVWSVTLSWGVEVEWGGYHMNQTFTVKTLSMSYTHAAEAAKLECRRKKVFVTSVTYRGSQKINA